jgi:hypothetical protein
MRYQNITDQTLIILNHTVKPGGIIEADLIENPNFEEVKKAKEGQEEK